MEIKYNKQDTLYFFAHLLPFYELVQKVHINNIFKLFLGGL